MNKFLTAWNKQKFEKVTLVEKKVRDLVRKKISSIQQFIRGKTTVTEVDIAEG